MNIDTLHHWPLVVTVEDCYVPQFAPFVIEAAISLPEEAITLIWDFAADKARDEARQQLN